MEFRAGDSRLLDLDEMADEAANAIDDENPEAEVEERCSFVGHDTVEVEVGHRICR